MAYATEVSRSAELTGAEVDAVLALVERTQQADGSAPLNEAALLDVRHGRAGRAHLLARAADQLVGYAQLEVDPGSGVAQLVVDPGHRRQGVGSRLVAELLDLATAPLRIWAVGDSRAAQRLAARSGLVVGRRLQVMARSLDGGWPGAPTPAGVAIRTFVGGQDEAAWLAVNARAFAHHPEQGSIIATDLAERMAEPWFDPAGFFVAVRAGALVGFHWTKQHPGRLGEVYVLGVDPQAGGAGLGRALLVTGLDHLRRQGDTVVELYVEADHDRAVGLYRAYGFAIASRDVMYVQVVGTNRSVDGSSRGAGRPDDAR